MKKDLVSIIIPDRNGQPYLQKTITDLLAKAEGAIEIIVVCDGIWSDPPLEINPNVFVVFHGTPHDNRGMRTGINRGIAVSHGEYIMKLDEHCMMDQGFDTKLKADCHDNWVVIPRRKRLLADTWELQIDGRPDIDYMHIDYPYQRPGDKTCGLHGAEWKSRAQDRRGMRIDETPSFQGSCYFLKRSYWDRLFPDGLNPEFYGEFTQEAQEIGNIVWLSGGQVMVNKNTWYAHMHKGKRGKGYGFSNEQYKRHMEGTERGRLYCIDYWLTTKDFIHDWKWFINVKFPDMPGWGTDWEERIKKDQVNDYSLSGNKKDWYENNAQI